MGRIESKVSQPYVVLSTLSGSGTSGYMTKWTGASSLGDSSILESDLITLMGTLFSTFTIVNNQAAAANVTGVLLSSVTERGALFEYDIYRNTDTGADELRANGRLRLGYRAESGAWEILGTDENGDSHGVTFTITSAGQLQYTSTNMAGANYVGKLVWKITKFPGATQLVLNNNQGVAGNLGLSFDIASHRGAVIEYDISRKTDTVASEVRAEGKLRVAYRLESLAWEILGQEEHGDVHGITFSITSAGVVQYTSTNIAGANYAGSLQYNLRRFDV